MLQRLDVLDVVEVNAAERLRIAAATAGQRPGLAAGFVRRHAERPRGLIDPVARPVLDAGQEVLRAVVAQVEAQRALDLISIRDPNKHWCLLTRTRARPSPRP